jgi:uncharacterized membrane protein
MLGDSGNSSDSINIRVWLIICFVGLILLAVYVAVQSLLPLD